MFEIQAEETRVLAAPAAAVYAVIADYGEAHRHIVPPQYFSDLVVTKGGTGAGTEISFRLHLLGGIFAVRARVDEPLPGRVLTETDLTTGAVTTFEVVPVEGGCSRVTIRTEWSTAGVKGMLEKLFVPRALRRLYSEELMLLEVRAAEYAAAMPA